MRKKLASDFTMWYWRL